MPEIIIRDYLIQRYGWSNGKANYLDMPQQLVLDLVARWQQQDKADAENQRRDEEKWNKLNK